MGKISVNPIYLIRDEYSEFYYNLSFLQNNNYHHHLYPYIYITPFRNQQMESWGYNAIVEYCPASAKFWLGRKHNVILVRHGGGTCL